MQCCCQLSHIVTRWLNVLSHEPKPQVVFCPLTSEDAQNSSCDGDLSLGLLGGRANLDALHSEERHDHGGESEQQRDDHQSTTCLHVNCREGNVSQPHQQTTITTIIKDLYYKHHK